MVAGFCTAYTGRFYNRISLAVLYGGIYLSFCKFTTVQDVTFVGLANYSKLLLDKTFSHSFWLTVIFAFVSSILINVLAFLLLWL